MQKYKKHKVAHDISTNRVNFGPLKPRKHTRGYYRAGDALHSPSQYIWHGGIHGDVEREAL